MQSIAVICNYRIDSNRIGGMDYFFWEFDLKSQELGYQTTWYFPNYVPHGGYINMNIVTPVNNTQSIENCFLNEIDSKRFDYVICHFLELCTPFFKRVKQISSTKIIAVDHNPRPFGGYSLNKRIKKIIYSILYERYIDKFVAVSMQTRKDLHFDFPFIHNSKSVIIFNGLPIEKILKRTHSINNKIQFIVSSHLRKEKGIRNIIDAVCLLPKKYRTKLNIDIFGDGPEKKNLELLINQNNLQNVIFLRGNSNKIHELYANYDYLIHPSFAETFCYTVVESLLANLPVITTENAGNILLLVNKKNGFTYQIGDVFNLAEILKCILKKNLIIFIDSRNEIKEKFSIEKMVERYLEIL